MAGRMARRQESSLLGQGFARGPKLWTYAINGIEARESRPSLELVRGLHSTVHHGRMRSGQVHPPPPANWCFAPATVLQRGVSDVRDRDLGMFVFFRPVRRLFLTTMILLMASGTLAQKGYMADPRDRVRDSHPAQIHRHG